MPIKVIGAGLGRTGTFSLKCALEELGFSRCYHMVDVLSNLDHARVWNAAARREPVDWDALYQGYQATVDWPSCSFYEDLMRHYPEAKVILTVRDPESWHESARQTIYHARHAFPRWLPPPPKMREYLRMLDAVIWNGMFDGKFADKTHAIDVFNRHNEQVRRVVPADRLLVYDIKEGWAPLCAFLGVPVPDGKPFPKLNDAREFRTRIDRAAVRVRTIAYSVLTVLAILLAGLVKYFWG
jgi:Sulfotransferase domain